MNPKILILLSIAQMGKFFSHFGVRTLLVLYMVQQLKYCDTHAFGVNAVFCSLAELSGICGGIIADRYLGLKRSLLFGSLLLFAGYFTLLLPQGLFPAMGLIVAGSALFSSNIMALLGLAYAESDPLRKKGFTLFYMLQNLGALVATLLCGFVATCYGFKWGFAVAASGMLLGGLSLLLGRSALNDLHLPSKKSGGTLSSVLMVALFVLATVAVQLAAFTTLLLPWIAGGVLLLFMLQLLKDVNWSQRDLGKLLLYLGALILFFAVEDQICSSLILFTERETARSLFGFTLPSSLITAVNPIVILLCGAWVAKRHFQLGLPFALTGASFGILALFCLARVNFPLLGVIGIVAVISLAELMIGPLVTSHVSKLSHKGNPGKVMGMIPIAFSLAFQLSGAMSKMVAIDNLTLAKESYGHGFAAMALLALAGGLLLYFGEKRATAGEKAMQPYGKLTLD